MTILKLLVVINKKLKNLPTYLFTKSECEPGKKKELVVSRGRDESRDGRHVSSHQAFQPIVNRRQDDVYAQWRSAKNDRVGIYHILVGKYMNDEEDPSSSFPLVYWEKHVPGPSFILSSKNGTGAVGNKRRNPAVFCQFSKKNTHRIDGSPSTSVISSLLPKPHVMSSFQEE